MEKSKMLPELAKVYSSFMKIDVSQELNPVQDVVDDLLTRLEETESIISMIHQEQEQEDILPDLIQCNENLKQMEVKVDKITALLAQVARNVNLLQTKVINAEQDFPTPSSESPFSSLFKFMKVVDTSVPSVPRNVNLSYEAPEIFRTSDYFPPSSEAIEPSTTLKSEQEVSDKEDR